MSTAFSLSAEDLLTQRYGQLDDSLLRALPETFNPVFASLLSHRTVRSFLPEALPEHTLEQLISAAQSAPSSSNLQLWSVVAVEQAERKKRLSALVGNQAHVRETPLFLAWLVDLSRIKRLGELQQTPADGVNYLDAFLTGVIDAALAAQNVVAAAESLGLGTVYIGALRNQPEGVKQELDLQDGVFAVFGLCIGKPDHAQASAVKPRLPQSAVLYREQYAARPVEQELGQYDDIMQAFYTSQNMPITKWSEHSVARLRDAESLKGRDRLHDALHDLGFQLR